MIHSVLTKSSSAAEALDVVLATQALTHMVPFDIQQSHHQLQDALDVGLAIQVVDDDFVKCQNAPYGQVLVLPSRRLVRPAAHDDFAIY